MNPKILLGLAVLAIGIFVLPETFALFSGQHNFYDTTLAGNQVPCMKCHADILAELNQPGQVNTLHRQQDPDGTGCAACHVTTAPAKENLTQGPGGQFHAAAAPACLDCHSGSGPGLSALEISNGTEEVHKAFYNESLVSPFLKGANEACISCHTHINVNITWTRATTIEFSSTEQVLSDGSHSWNITNFNATGTNTTITSGTG